MAAGRRLTLEKNKLIWRRHLSFVFRKIHREAILKSPMEMTPWELSAKETCYVMRKPNTLVARLLLEIMWDMSIWPEALQVTFA